MVKSIRIINTIPGTTVLHGEQSKQFSNNIINSITGSVFSKRGTSTQKRWLCCNRHRFKTQKTHNNINRISTGGLVSEKPKIKQGLTLSRSPRVVPPPPSYTVPQSKQTFAADKGSRSVQSRSSGQSDPYNYIASADQLLLANNRVISLSNLVVD